MPRIATGRMAAALAALGLLAALALAAWSAANDSATVDEPSHLVAGYAALERGDFRLSPDHPPLARLLLALPLLAGDTAFLPPPGTSAAAAAAWRSGDFFTLGHDFLESWNDGRRLVARSRAVAVGLLALLLLTLYRVAARLFGPAGGAVALLAAAFDPTLLAHGHLATIDVPFTLAALLALVSFDAWLRRPGLPRLALAALAFAAVLLVKFSFFALLPALAAMALAARCGREPRPARRRLALAGAALAAVAFLAIWATYHFRFAAAAGPEAELATMHVLGDAGRPLPTRPEEAWESVLHDPATGADRPGPLVPVLRFLHSQRLLPEAYLYGAAYVAKKGLVRASYLRGRYSMTGFPDYFLWAFAIKTPIATLVLAALGLAALLSRRRTRPATDGHGLGAGARLAPPLHRTENLGDLEGEAEAYPADPTTGFRRGNPPATGALPAPSPERGAGGSGPAAAPRQPIPPLAWGLAVFALVYLAALLSSALNLGVRHLLPVMPLLWLAAGAAWPADTGTRLRRLGRVVVAALLLWLAAGTVAAAPRLIGYFNESIGGWRQGHLYLADSNLDWGQDLLRLETRLRREPPAGPVWLAQAGDPPLPRGLAELRPRRLIGSQADPAPIAGGLYAIGATELLGVYRPLARAEAWRDPRLLARYEQLAEEESLLRRGAAATGEILPIEVLRRLRLIARLAGRAPDERVGASLFLFRLSDRDVAEATAP